MSVVYVDTARTRWQRGIWCHLFSEDIEALHRFAHAIGTKRAWFQCPPLAKWPHYDIPSFRRVLALHIGAVEADRRTFVRIARQLQAAWHQENPP